LFYLVFTVFPRPLLFAWVFAVDLVKDEAVFAASGCCPCRPRFVFFPANLNGRTRSGP